MAFVETSPTATATEASESAAARMVLSIPPVDGGKEPPPAAISSAGLARPKAIDSTGHAIVESASLFELL